MVKKNRQNIIILSIVSVLTLVAVFFALNETFGWLSSATDGTPQKFKAGDIKLEYNATYKEIGRAHV